MITIIIFLFIGIVSCASTPVAGECKETTSERCLGGKTCAFDEGRQCMVCHCEEPADAKDAKEIRRLQGDEPPGP